MDCVLDGCLRGIVAPTRTSPKIRETWRKLQLIFCSGHWDEWCNSLIVLWVYQELSWKAAICYSRSLDDGMFALYQQKKNAGLRTLHCMLRKTLWHTIEWSWNAGWNNLGRRQGQDVCRRAYAFACQEMKNWKTFGILKFSSFFMTKSFHWLRRKKEAERSGACIGSPSHVPPFRCPLLDRHRIVSNISSSSFAYFVHFLDKYLIPTILLIYCLFYRVHYYGARVQQPALLSLHLQLSLSESMFGHPPTWVSDKSRTCSQSAAPTCIVITTLSTTEWLRDAAGASEATLP